MNLPQQAAPLDFENIEHQLNLDNLQEMAWEIPQRSDRLATRVKHFSDQFDIPEEHFWRGLEANPTGPLAAVLAREARRQNVHEKTAAEYVGRMANIEDFQKLKSTGKNACYINADGQIVTNQQLAGARYPSKSIDFRWRTGNVICYAVQKYTKEGGGNQDTQFNEIVRLLQNFQRHTNNATTLFVLVDSPYYTDQRLAELRGLTRRQSPCSYVASINELQPILNQIATGG